MQALVDGVATASESELCNWLFGQIKEARGFRPCLLRGREAVNTKGVMICTAHNLVTLARAESARNRCYQCSC